MLEEVALTLFVPDSREEDGGQKTTQTGTQRFTEQQEAIILYLKEHPHATRSELSQVLVDITEDGVKYNLSRLQELGVLQRVGGRKMGHWEVIE